MQNYWKKIVAMQNTDLGDLLGLLYDRILVKFFIQADSLNLFTVHCK